ncbi:MAG: PQQ-binding-like beta-propeller repeat protein [Candidatus Auribacterota bacterium]|nr:PQQ-binding-like beta-propeller repeat protein [Candidatus Auribacterota bacterium]
MLTFKQFLVFLSLVIMFPIITSGIIAADSLRKTPSDPSAKKDRDNVGDIPRPQLLWRFKSKGSFSSRAAVSGDRIVVGDNEGTLSCLSRRDGDRIWSRRFSGYFAAAPLIEGGRVYITPSRREITYYRDTGGSIFKSSARVTRTVEEDGEVRCLDLNYGRRRWKRRLSAPIHSSPVLGGDYLLVGCLNYKIYCLDRERGAIIWDFKTNGPIDQSPAVSDGMVLVGSGGGDLFCLELENGKERWRVGLGKKVVSSPVCRDGIVYVGAADEKVYAISLKTGRPIWKVGLDGVLTGDPVFSRDFIYAATSSGKLFCLAIKDGRIRWATRPSHFLLLAPRETEGSLIASNDKGVIYSFNMEDGEVRWKYHLFSGFVAGLTLSGNKIFASSSDRKLYCLEMEKNK